MAQRGKATGSKARITKRAIDDLRSEAKSEGRTLYLRDDELTGFGALSTKAGACSYFVEYRPDGRGTTQKRMTIGKHGALTPDEARKLAKEELGKVARRVDVAQERKEERARLKADTFRDVSERYFAVNGKREKTGEWESRRWKEVHAMLEKSVYPVLGSKVPDAISRFELASLITKQRRGRIPSHVASMRRCGLSSHGLSSAARSRTTLWLDFVARSLKRHATAFSMTPR